MRKGATAVTIKTRNGALIVALRNEKGSYSGCEARIGGFEIVALRNEKGSYS